MITLFDSAHNAGRITQTPSGSVLHVAAGPADIEYRRHVRGYVKLAARRYYVVSTRVRYATLAAAVEALKTTKGNKMYEHVYQAIDKRTGEILAESIAPAPLEERFAEHGHLVYIRNDKTGVEWEIPGTDEPMCVIWSSFCDNYIIRNLSEASPRIEIKCTGTREQCEAWISAQK